MGDISERKVYLRDWMTATSQMMYLNAKDNNADDPLTVTMVKFRGIGIRMNPKWLIRALKIKG